MKKRWQPKPLWNRCTECGLLAKGPKCLSKDQCDKETISFAMKENKEETQLRSAEEMTLQQYKDQVAVELGYKSFEHLYREFRGLCAPYSKIITCCDEAAELYASQFKPSGVKTEWMPLTERLPEEIDVRIKLVDGSELNVWTQSDGDFWYELFDKFISADRVTHWKPRKPK